MTSERIRLATRGSDLALAQTREVAARLRECRPGLDIVEEIFRTAGDKNLEADLAKSATLDKGLFTKELEEALLDGRADAAVHSLKDLPTSLPEGLVVAAVLPRADTADVIVSHTAGGLDALPAGAMVGTGSPRRQAMLLAARGDLAAVPIRGNVPTRLGKLVSGGYDAIILAAAGLERLGFASFGDLVFEGARLHVSRLDGFLPAPGQGAIAIETRRDDARVRALLQPLHDEATDLAVRAERAVLAGLGGGCRMPLGTRARIDGEMLRLDAVLFDVAGSPPRYATLTGAKDDPEALGRAVAAQLRGV